MANYMEDILPALSEPDGIYYAVGISDAKEIRHVPCRTHDEICEACFGFSQMGWSAYFAQASFKGVSQGRKQANVDRLKAFWLDVDVGKKNNSYPTRDEALKAIITFTNSTNMPPSYIMSSGGGFYVYWCLSEGVEPKRWKDASLRLQSLCMAKGLIADPACTSDTARILRLRATVHPKTGNVVRILKETDRLYTIDEFETWLNGQNIPQVEPAAPTTCREPTEATYSARPIVENCAQMRDASMGAEPSWFAMMSVLKRCVDGREWAHKLSSMDGRYKPEDTDKKFDYAKDDAPATCALFDEYASGICPSCKWRGLIKSPVELYRRCATFEVLELDKAEPVQPVKPVEKPAPVEKIETETTPGEGDVPVDILPASAEPVERVEPLNFDVKFKYAPIALQSDQYSVTKDGMVWCERKVDKDGGVTETKHLISKSRIVYLNSTFQKKGEDAYEWKHRFQAFDSNDNPISPLTAFEASDVASPQQMYAKLLNMNVLSTDLKKYSQPRFSFFMNTYLDHLISGKKIRTINISDSFGWSTEKDQRSGDEELSFLTGAGRVTAEGLKEQKYTDIAAQMKEHMRPTGSIEEWLEIPRMYRRLGQPLGMLAHCANFAAPLMKYGSGAATNATFHIWSVESGRGKTQLIRGLASAWGHPDKQFIERNSTPNSKVKYLTRLSNIPAFMDELTDIKDEELFSLAYTLAGGQEKSRLSRSGREVVPAGDWNTITFCTANKSMKEACSASGGYTAAAMLRVIESRCVFEDYSKDPAIQKYILRCVSLCNKNYGLAGPEFVYQLLKHQDRLQTLSIYVDNWVSKHQFTNEERFLANPLALFLKAGRWAVEWGLLDYDMDKLEEWAINEFVPENRGSNAMYRKGPYDVLFEYLLYRQANLLCVVKDIRLGRPPSDYSPDTEYVKVFPQKGGEVYLRYAMDTDCLYFTKIDFNNWCKRMNGWSGEAVLKQLENKGMYMSIVRKSLTSGAKNYNQPAVECVKIESDTLREMGFSLSAFNYNGMGYAK